MQKLVQIIYPQWNAKFYDLIITPKHDKKTG